MFIVRRVNANDLDSIEMLAMSYSMGVTSLPKNRYKLQEKLLLSLASFDKFVEEPSHELYLFLLEDSKTGAIGGISGIMARCGTYEAVHFFRIETLRNNKGFELPSLQVLHPISFQFGPSEICSLFLLKEFRKGGLGKLLSFSRFLFMASHPHRFDDTTIAEMRGMIKPDNTSPFWDSVGRHFVNMTFQGAMALRDKGLFHYYNLIPEFPIYTSMLPKRGRACIGKVHQNTKAALKMLLQQGFHLTNDIDVFDGGPVIEAKTADIKTIRRSRQTVISGIDDKMEQGQHAIISTVTMDFKACYTNFKKLPNGKLVIPLETAQAMKLDVGSTVRYITISKG
jgi:arginine N-succinyltransferase